MRIVILDNQEIYSDWTVYFVQTDATDAVVEAVARMRNCKVLGVGDFATFGGNTCTLGSLLYPRDVMECEIRTDSALPYRGEIIRPARFSAEGMALGEATLREAAEEHGHAWENEWAQAMAAHAATKTQGGSK